MGGVRSRREATDGELKDSLCDTVVHGCDCVQFFHLGLKRMYIHVDIH